MVYSPNKYRETEGIKVRRIGYALDVATLQQVAYNHGITDSIQNMTQAQKSQIRYIAIMEQSKNALGDMARTLESPANQMRIFSQRVDQLKRAIGNGLMPIISAALPWVTAFVKLLTEGAQKIADFLGFEIPKFDYGDLIADSNKGISSSFDDATKAAKEFKGTLSSIDQLNIIGSEKDTSGTGLGDMYDLNIDLPSYDFLGGLEESVDSAYNTMKKFFNQVISGVKEALPWIGALAAGFVGIKLGGLISQIPKITTLFAGLTSKLTPMATALGAGATSGVLLYNGFKNLITGSGKLNTNIASLAGGLGIAGAAIAGFIAFGNPVGAVITGIAAAVGAVAGVIQGVDENITKMNKKMSDSMLFNNGGTKISEVADAFGEWAKTAELVNRQTIDKYSELGDYDTEMDNLLKTMEGITGIDLNLDEISPADAEALRQPFSSLCTYLETDFKKRTQTVANDIKDIFTKLGLGEVVSSEIGQAYTEMQELFSRNLTESQTVVDEYLKQIAAGGKLTEAQQLEFANEYSYVTGRSKLEDQSYMDVQKALTAFSNLDLSKIDFETDKTTQNALQQILDSAMTYQDSALERYKAEIDNLDQLRQYVEYDYRSGKLTDTEYKNQIELLDFSERVFAENLNSELDEVAENINKVLAPINLRLDQTASKIKPTLSQTILAQGYAQSELRGFDTDYISQLAHDVAKGEWLENNPIHQMTQELEDFVSETHKLTVETELPVDNQYYDTFELIKSARNGEVLNQKINVEFINDSESIDWAEKAGKWLEEGLEKGWSISTWEKYSKELADAGAKAFCETYGIHSPSTLFEGFGEYMMMGLQLGVERNERSVLNEFDSLSKDLNNSLTIAPLDWSALMGETPETDFSKVYTPSSRNSYYMRSSEPTQTAGYDVASVMEMAQLIYAAQDGNPTEFTIYTNVELDGEAVGAAVTRSQDYQMRMSNGR